MILRVEQDGELVGNATVRGGRFDFRYDGGWHSSPISVRLPVREQPYDPDEAHPYFANLLPEGAAREALAARLGVSRDNDVALLVALGDDTAGALRLVADESRPARKRQQITLADLQSWATGTPAFFDDPDQPPRLSLAGAQHKTSAVETAAGFALPASDEASTHILKFDSPRFHICPRMSSSRRDSPRRWGSTR